MSTQMKVLLVEDSKTQARFIKRELSAAGCSLVVHETSLSAALETLDREVFDIVLLDLELPDSAGVTTVSRIYRKTPFTPIIVLTGQGDETLAHEAIRAGAQEYLLKSVFSAKILKRVFLYAIRRKQIETDLRRNLKNQEIVASILRISLGDITLESLLSEVLSLVADKQDLGFVPKGFIILLDSNKDEPAMAAHLGFPKHLMSDCLKLQMWRSLCEKAATTKEVVFADQFDHRHEDACEGIEHYGSYYVPIQSDGTVLGVMCLFVPEGHKQSNSDNRFLTMVGNALAGIIRRKIAEDEVKKTQVQLVQSAKLASLGEMATGIAHELNQPLNIIQMSAESLSELLEEEESLPKGMLKKKLERITSQTNRAAAIIDHMQNFGHRKGKDSKEVSLAEAVANVNELISGQLRLREIELDIDLPDACRPVKGNSVQLEQVILNLITNARDAIETNNESEILNGRSRRITIGIQDDPSIDSIRLEVADTGGGILEPHLGRIFEPFFTTKAVGRGAGLGLTIAYGIITEMGGRVEATNADDGAKFTITLPVADIRSGPKD